MTRLSAFLALAFAAVAFTEAASDDARPTHTVARGPLAVTVDLDGAYESPEAFEARFRPEAYGGDLVIHSIAGHGASVRKGDVVLSFETAGWQKAVAAAENELRAAESNFKAASDAVAWGERQDAISLANSKEHLAATEKELEYFNTIDGPQMLKYAEMGLKSFKDNVADQEEELKQLEDMYKSEELTTETADIVRNRARRSLENSKIYLKMREEAAKKTPDWDHPRRKRELERNVEQAKVGLAQTESNIANGKVQREAQMVRTRAERDRQAEALEKLKRDGDRLTIASPIDGWAIYGQLAQGNWTTNDDLLKTLKPGEKCAQQQVILTVIPSSAAGARVLVPEDKAASVKSGQTATVAALGTPNAKAPGRVSDISPVPVGGSFAARVALASPAEKVVPGMRCKVSIQVADLKDVVLVPASAVGAEGGKPAVWVLEGGKERAVEVALGATNGQLHEVKSGLKGGESILLNAPKK